MECLQRHTHADPNVCCQTLKAPVLTLDACFDVEEVKRGRYSVISRACCDGLQIAIKTYDRPSLVPKKHKMATREAIVLKYLNSQGVPNITHMWSAYASQDKFHILMEFCSGGNLLERLKAAAGPMTEQHLATMVAAPLLRTLASMHAAGVTHRDIKLENIFMDAHGHPKLGDFDLAVFHHEAPARAPVGTIFYMAPEVLLLASARGTPMEAAIQRRVSEKMDVWSLGVCLFELAAGYKPFQGVSYEAIASAIIQAAMADLPHHLSSSFRSFIAAALTYDPAQRPSAQQLLDHPWIQVHSPVAVRSDSAGSLMDISHNGGIKQQCASTLVLQQQQQGSQQQVYTSNKAAAVTTTLKQNMAAGSYAPLQQQAQQHHCHYARSCSSGGGSSGCCDIVSGSSGCGHTSGASSCGSSGSVMMKCTSRDLGPCNAGGPVAVTAVAAAAGMVSCSTAAAGSAIWVHQQQVGSCVGASVASSPFYAAVGAMPALPGLRLRNNSSLGTQYGDWSTTDSSATCCSPHSIMHRLGLGSSGTLGRQLMPWASLGSTAQGFNVMPGAEGSQLPHHQQQQQQGVQQLSQQSSGGQVVPPQWGHSTCTIQQQQQQSPLQQQLAPGGTANGSAPVSVSQPAVRSDSSSGADSSAASPAGAAAHLLQQQQQGQATASAAQHGAAHAGPQGNSNSSDAAPQQQLPATTAPPKMATAASSSHVPPLALAVAAAVAEHNKKQPRMWTPFALRAHQLRVAQVLLAERQKVGNQAPPPPPAQPLMPLQATRLPVVDDNEPEQQQQQQMRPQAGQDSPHPCQAAAENNPQQQQQRRPMAVMGPELPAQQVHQRTTASVVLPLQPVQQPVQARVGSTTSAATSATSATVPAGGDVMVPAGGDVMVQPLVHQMQQHLSMGAAPVSSGGGSSSAGSSAADSGRPPKPAKKAWLACFVPRAFE